MDIVIVDVDAGKHRIKGHRRLAPVRYADTKSRSERAVQEYHVDERRVEAMLRKIDKRRETFYSINTGGNWYDKDNYDLCLNSGALGLELCADIVVETAKKTIYR